MEKPGRPEKAAKSKSVPNSKKLQQGGSNIIATKKNKREDEHYVNNAEFLQHMEVHIKEVKKAKKEHALVARAAKALGEKPPPFNPPQVSEFIGLCIMKIANKLANKPNFMNYPFREEMIADGIENCLQYLNNFDPKKSNNPFAYFTQMIFFAFVRRIQKEKKHLYIKYKAIENTLLHEVPEMDAGAAPTKYGSDESDAFMHEFVANFEKGREKKKNRARSRKKKRFAQLPDLEESETTDET